MQILDRDRLRDVTLGNDHLAREILALLIEDCGHQLDRLAAAIRDGDAVLSARLAHYARGACANVGAQAAASTLATLERQAQSSNLPACRASLSTLRQDLEALRETVGYAVEGLAELSPDGRQNIAHSVSCGRNAGT